MAMVEAALLGLLGSVVGVGVGAFLTWALVGLHRAVDFDPPFIFSWAVAAAVVALGAGSVVLAAFYPTDVVLADGSRVLAAAG